MTADMQPRDVHNIRRWATIVGVNHYEDPAITNLRYSVSDANALFQLLLTQNANGFEKERLCLLMSGKETEQAPIANRRSILHQLADMADMTQKDDLFLFYFAGHGDVIDGEAYLLPSDARVKHLLADTAIPLKRVKEIMLGAAARAKVILLDACYAGVKVGRRTANTFNKAFIKSVFEEAEGMGILAASTRSEASWESVEIGHGIFTHFLLKGLAGEAKDPNTPFVPLNILARYVTHNVKEWAANHHIKQRPSLDFKGVGEVVLTIVPPETLPAPFVGMHIVNNSRSNPIERTFPIAVKEIDDFFNRTTVLARIQQILASTTDMPIALRGDRGLGKTSVLNRIKKMLEEPVWNGRHFHYFSISPTGVYTFDDFAREIWDGLVLTLQMSDVHLPEALAGSFQFQTFGRFAAQLAQLYQHTPDITFVVFIDEFGQIIRQCNNLEYNRIEGLINYIVEATEFPLVFILSLLQELPESYGSPIPMSTITLHPLAKEDACQMVSTLLHGYAKFSQESFDWLYDYTGGHPFFLKLLLTKLFDRFDLSSPQQLVTPTMLQQIIPDACRSTRADEILRDVYTTYMSEEERFVLLWLASHQEKLSDREIRQNGTKISVAASQLFRRDFLAIDDNQNYHFRIRFFGDWLRTWPKYISELERLGVPDSPTATTASYVQNIEPAQACSPPTIIINRSTQEIQVHGQKIEETLHPLDYNALVYLIERVNEVVSKDELANHIYPGDYYEGDDGPISAIIYRLRQVLGDKKLIQTLRKRGYRIQDASFV